MGASDEVLPEGAVVDIGSEGWDDQRCRYGEHETQASKDEAD